MANTWDDWLRAYEAAYRSPTPPLQLPCPNCGARALSLLFREKTSDGVGHVFFWCGSCRFGIHLSRVDVPDGAAFIPYDAPADEQPLPPSYTLVHPEDSEDEGEDVESEVF
ncbi:hypothetical protein DMB38_13910 [Streptomyces sp. WAC 06738]|uniref:hypothetical protein n=1 Tax=Streptomyces sp. WAC 06738 TaxID=2203210 RepID=UPI000F6EA0D1|nr:hypothetical protein [Streptomyces sp. WAC 06738]AZM46761.1 hypothetical protein DMB38_13910 [Streptomyces sp. WAC 06738]